MDPHAECAIYLQQLWLAQIPLSTSVYAMHRNFGVAMSGYVIQACFERWDHAAKMCKDEVEKDLAHIMARYAA